MKRAVHTSALSFEERLEIVKNNPVSKTELNTLPTFIEKQDIAALLKKSASLSDSQLQLMYSTEFLEKFNNICGSVTSESGSFISKNYGSIQNYIYEVNGQVDYEVDYGVFFFAEVIGKIEEFVQELSQIVDTTLLKPELINQITLSSVSYEIRKIVNSTFLFEGNIAAKNNWISASNQQSQLESYCELLANEEYKQYISDKYPLITRKIEDRLELTFNSLKKLFERLCADKAEIASLCGIEDEISVTDVSRGEGDSHHGADSVSIITINKDYRIVYKPRCLSPEIAFQNLLNWVNSTDAEFDFKVLKVITKESYGYMEFVEHDTCDNSGDIEVFYFRYGGLIALTHLVRGTDIHFENLIACGDQPVIVDLETIIQPTEFSGNNGDHTDHIMGLKYLNESIYYTALVDHISLFSPPSSGSPLIKAATEERKYKISFCHELRNFKDEKEFKESIEHLPCSNNVNVGYLSFKKQIIEGFRKCYKLLLNRKYELTSGGVLESIFGLVNLRVVLRYTSAYTELLDSLNTSYALRHFNNQEEYLFKLLRIGQHQSAFLDFALAEQIECYRGDVPYFYTSSKSSDLISSTGQIFKGTLKESGFSAIKNNFLLFNKVSLEREIDCLNYALEHGSKLDEKEVTLSDNDTIQGVCVDIYDAVMRRVILTDESYLYVEPVTGLNNKNHVKNIESDLYNGAAGIAFSLLYGGQQFDSQEYQVLAQDITNRLLKNLDPDSELFTGICNGLGGHIYLLSHLGYVLNESFYIDIAELYAEKLEKITYRDRYYDLFFGSAGAILALLALYSVNKNDRTLEIAKNCGYHLLEHAIDKGEYIVWKSNSPSNDIGTSGFAHGSAGILYSLLKLYEASKEKIFLDALLKGEKYLNRCFDPDSGNWFETLLDKVDSSTGTEGQDMWCHGAPGIGLFYIELAKVLGTNEYSHYIDFSKSVCELSIPYDNDCICHGTLGNLEIPLRTTLKSDAVNKAKFDNFQDSILEEVLKQSPTCGTAANMQSLSLFTGYSGIAYQLMRLRSINFMPSLLTFEPPVQE